MNKNEAFSRIPNDFYYNLELKKDNPILNNDNSTKVLLVMHNLSVLTNRENMATITINYLIEKCGYSVTKKIQPTFKDILNELKELGYIDFKVEIQSYTNLIEINTENLEINTNFFVVENDELNIIRQATDNTREQNNLVKLYFYLKARVYKAGENDSLDIPQTTYVSYENISQHTGVSERNIKKYIDILVALKLVHIRNLGTKVINNKVSECANLYALTKVSKTDERLEYDLTYGLKQQEHYYKELGYKILKKKKEK